MFIPRINAPPRYQRELYQSCSNSAICASVVGGHICDTLSGMKFIDEDFFLFGVPRLTSAHWEISSLYNASGCSLLKGISAQKEGSNHVSPGKNLMRRKWVHTLRVFTLRERLEHLCSFRIGHKSFA